MDEGKLQKTGPANLRDSSSAIDPKKKIEEIGHNLEAIRRRIEEAEKQKGEFVKGKMKDREGLLAKLAELEDLRKQVEKNIEGLNLVAKKDKRFAEDPEFQAQLKAVEKLVSDIIDQQAEINNQIDTISIHPDVETGLHDEANLMNQGFDKRKEAEKQSAEFTIEAKNFANEVADYAESYNNFFVKRDGELAKAVQVEVKVLNKILDDALLMFKEGDGSKKGYTVAVAIRDVKRSIGLNVGKRLDGAMDELAKVRKSLGMFGNKSEKLAIDYIMKEHDTFERYRIAQSNYDNWQKRIDDIGKIGKDLVEKCRALSTKNRFRNLDGSTRYSILSSEVSKIATTKPGGTYKNTNFAFRGIYQEAERSI